jgi:hypothetical protein
MSEPVDFSRRVKIAFDILKGKTARHEPGALSETLADRFTKSNRQTEIEVEPDVAAMFTTASVDMWMRAVHSFLVSAALTKTSPLWASVAGYYSSHYTIRAYAHLLGVFQIFRIKMVARLEIASGSGGFSCKFDSKDGRHREHGFYWKVVNAENVLASSQLFVRNINGIDASDCAHREKANYQDHLGNFPEFNPFTKEDLKVRLDRLSQIGFSPPQIPRASHFPDLDNVQLIAYHRLVHFRRNLDNILGDSSFWRTTRDPSWAKEWTRFQLPEVENSLSQIGI